MKQKIIALLLPLALFIGCKKKETTGNNPAKSFTVSSVTVDGKPALNTSVYNASAKPLIIISFNAPVDTDNYNNIIYFTAGSTNVAYSLAYQNNDSTLQLQPLSPLPALTPCTIAITNALKSKSGMSLAASAVIHFSTAMDTTDKFARITDSALLDLVQAQTLKYFWDFGHPTSGLARERNTSGDVVTTGGSGFGIMAVLVGIQRNFISRADGLARLNKITDFLGTAQRYHGAFPHWMNGVTGVTIPFSTNDDGADLVETSYLMEGLLCARQFFSSASDANEISLRGKINTLWDAVEWNWFRQNNQNVLYWHWSPDHGWAINAQIRGWNECFITYMLAASSNTDSIPNVVYTAGWANNGSIVNGNTYYGIQLPLGGAYGGPLFFAHYSWMGIDPNGLTDMYANYGTQNTAHSKINYSYCVDNPKHYNGYSSNCWGLTASDEQGGYSAHAPDNDDGVISPTAAISSLPYTPTESMNALRFFYYKLGDKIWDQYGFKDAFNLTNVWFADSYLAIDQGPQVVMIENYRSKMMWNLFMSCPEIKRGMQRLGFQSPHF